jgi:anaerobic selenocysteine-containing dehydrogenase
MRVTVAEHSALWASEREDERMAGAVRTTATMCPMNCHPTLCGMLVDVRDGELVGVRGDKDNPDSQGFLCVRGQASRQIIGNPARLGGRCPSPTTPGARRAGMRHST